MNKEVVEPAIRKIIKKIPKGLVFDAHFIIDRLFIKYPNVYIRFVASFGRRANITINSVHGQISQVVASFEGTLIERLPYHSLSKNILGNVKRPCKIWVKK